MEIYRRLDYNCMSIVDMYLDKHIYNTYHRPLERACCKFISWLPGSLGFSYRRFSYLMKRKKPYEKIFMGI